MFDNLVKNLGKDDFKYVSKELDSKVLDFVKQKDFISMIKWMVLKNVKKDWIFKKSFTVRSLIKKWLIKIWDRFKMKTTK